MMTNRELFMRIMTFKTPDRTPFYLIEGMSGQTDRRWYRHEDLPVHMNGFAALDYDVKLFDLSTEIMKNDQPPLPSFFPRRVHRDDRYVRSVDIHGNTTQGLTGHHYSPSTNVYVDFPLKTMEDWRQYKKRFDPLDPRRLPACWNDDMFDYYNSGADPVVLNMTWGPARGIKTFYQFGLERFMEIIQEEPGIIHDMFEFWTDFMIQYIDAFLEKIKIDAFVLNEDGIAYKNSLMVSPEIYRRLYTPYVRALNAFLASRGVAIRGYYSSGHLNPLIPTLLESGFNFIGPIESSSGMNAVDLRKEYGKDLLMIGNLSRDAVLMGKAAIERDVMEKVPFLMEAGGYIPALDDIITPDMTMENVRYLIELVKSV